VPGCGAFDNWPQIAGSKQIIPTRMTFVDYMPVWSSASKGEGNWATKFPLQNIRGKQGPPSPHCAALFSEDGRR